MRDLSGALGRRNRRHRLTGDPLHHNGLDRPKIVTLAIRNATIDGIHRATT
jgi:hypothetical protein